MITQQVNMIFWLTSLQWRHNERNDISNHQHVECLLNRFFRCRSENTSKLHVTGLCEENSSVAGEFPAQRASDTENALSWWRHNIYKLHGDLCRSMALSTWAWWYFLFRYIMLHLGKKYSSRYEHISLSVLQHMFNNSQRISLHWSTGFCSGWGWHSWQRCNVQQNLL